MLFNHQFIYLDEGAALLKGSLAFNEHLDARGARSAAVGQGMPFTVMAIGLFLPGTAISATRCWSVRFVAQFSLLQNSCSTMVFR